MTGRMFGIVTEVCISHSVLKFELLEGVMGVLTEEQANEQMQRFLSKIAAGEMNHVSLRERGLLYTLIAMSPEKNVVGAVEDVLPDSKECLRGHLQDLVDSGFVSLDPMDAGKQISRKHYVVNL